jgi:hypothetical protein
MEEERKARQKYVDGPENTGHRRSVDYHSEERERRRGDTINQKDREKEAEAIRVS